MVQQTAPWSIEHPSMEYLTYRGPHQVAGGELSAIGFDGLVFAPETGPRCPAIVLGHGYLQPPRRYADTLRYLASWGFVAAAPASEGGPIPSHAGLALDMLRTLERLADAKLHRGRVTVDPERLGVIGHGIGGGAAVLAAASASLPIRAAMTMFASPISPSAVDAAQHITVPGLQVTGGHDRLAARDDDGEAIARAWAGPSQLRVLEKADHLALAEGSHFTSTLLGAKGSKKTQQAIRTLATGFFLLHVAGHEQLADEMTGKIAGTKPMDLAAATSSPPHVE